MIVCPFGVRMSVFGGLTNDVPGAEVTEDMDEEEKESSCESVEVTVET